MGFNLNSYYSENEKNYTFSTSISRYDFKGNSLQTTPLWSFV